MTIGKLKCKIRQKEEIKKLVPLGQIEFWDMLINRWNRATLLKTKWIISYKELE